MAHSESFLFIFFLSSTDLASSLSPFRWFHFAESGQTLKKKNPLDVLYKTDNSQSACFVLGDHRADSFSV